MNTLTSRIITAAGGTRFALLTALFAGIPETHPGAVWQAMHVASSLVLAYLLALAVTAGRARALACAYGEPKTLHLSRRDRSQRPGQPPRTT